MVIKVFIYDYYGDHYDNHVSRLRRRVVMMMMTMRTRMKKLQTCRWPLQLVSQLDFLEGSRTWGSFWCICSRLISNMCFYTLHESMVSFHFGISSLMAVTKDKCWVMNSSHIGISALPSMCIFAFFLFHISYHRISNLSYFGISSLPGKWREGGRKLVEGWKSRKMMRIVKPC